MTTTLLDHAAVNEPNRWLILGVALFSAFLNAALSALLQPFSNPEIMDAALSISFLATLLMISTVTGIAAALIGGAAGDRWGTRRMLLTVCCIGGLMGVLSLLPLSPGSLVLTFFLLGIVSPMLTVNLYKIAVHHFPSRQWGLAMGLIATSVAAGSIVGASGLTRALLQLFLVGWQDRLLLYGLTFVVMGGIWFLLHPREVVVVDGSPGENKRARVSFRRALRHVLQLRAMWLMGLGIFFYWAIVDSFVINLSTYLQSANSSLTFIDVVRINEARTAILSGMGLIAILPLALLSDWLQIRRGLLLVAPLLLFLLMGLAALHQDIWLWVALPVAGAFTYSFGVIYQAMVLEMPTIGRVYAGAALGFVTMLRAVSDFATPILTALFLFSEEFSLPIVFLWSIGLAIAAVCMFLFFPRPDTAQSDTVLK